jgi:predicted small metal-binding protein
MQSRAVITCECGFEARATDEDGLVAEVRRHAAEAHCMPLSREQALLLVFHAELAAQPTYATRTPALPARWGTPRSTPVTRRRSHP